MLDKRHSRASRCTSSRSAHSSASRPANHGTDRPSTADGRGTRTQGWPCSDTATLLSGRDYVAGSDRWMIPATLVGDLEPRFAGRPRPSNGSSRHESDSTTPVRAEGARARAVHSAPTCRLVRKPSDRTIGASGLRARCYVRHGSVFTDTEHRHRWWPAWRATPAVAGAVAPETQHLDVLCGDSRARIFTPWRLSGPTVARMFGVAGRRLHVV